MVLRPLRSAPLFGERGVVGSHVPYMTRMLIVIMNLLGFSMGLIIKWSGHTQRTIQRWVDRFEDSGNVFDQAGRGRNLITSDTIDSAIISAAEEYKFITPRVIRNKVQVRASIRTVRRRLNEVGLFGRVARFSWPLSQDHLDARLKFANDYADWDGNDWSTVLFTDECNIYMDNQSQIWVQRPEDTAYFNEYMTHQLPNRSKISIWAGFSAHGVTQIHIIEGNLDKYQLVDILAEEIPAYSHRVWGQNRWCLLQDNSPIHRSDVVEDWLVAKGIRTFDYPSYSPDLNPIENVWAWLKRQLDQDFHTDLADLRKSIMDHWNNMPIEILLALVQSMPKRLEAVRVQRGFKTKY